jgi:sugar phosphate permease
VLRTPTLGYLFVGGAMISFGMNGLVGWGPTFLSRELGLSAGASARLFGTWGLVAGTAGTIAGGYIADWLRGSRWLARSPGASRVITVAFGVVVGGILTIVLLYVRDLRLFGPIFTVAFFFLTWYNGPMAAAIFDVVPARIGATVMGAFLLFIHLAGDAIAFPLVGALSDRFGIHNAVMLLPVVAVLGGLVTLFAVRTVAYDMGRAASRPTGNFPALP